MARSPAIGGPSAAESTTLIFPKESVWKDLVEKQRQCSTRAQSHSGIYARAVKEAVEKDHVDRRALSIVTRLAKLDDEDLS